VIEPATAAVRVAPSDAAGLRVVVDALTNDGDPDDRLDGSTLRIVESPSKGTASVADGRITYTSGSAYAGSDSLRSEVCDTGSPRGCARATVNVTSAPAGP